jgi:lipopolysaccharide export system protein LptA
MKGINALRSSPSFAWLLFGITIFSLSFSQVTNAQKKTRIHIEDADFLRFDKRGGRDVQKLIGDVRVRQDSTLFFCDSAFLDNSRNNLQAFGNVHIIYNDSVDVYGDYLDYNGNTKVAELEGNVKLVDDSTTLVTDYLIYNRISRLAFYNAGGTIYDRENTLSSIIGTYNTSDKNFYFRDSVVLVNPDYILHSDTLQYNTISEVVYIFGPTDIVGEKDSIYSEYGWYDTKKNRVSLKKNAFVRHLEQSLRADSIYFDQEVEQGYAWSNVIMDDTVQDVMVLGEYAYFNDSTGISFITDSARAVFIDREDSLFMHADTIKVLSDSLDRADKILAYYKMKFFRKDLQGACDSLVYLVRDSVINLYKDPVLWTDENQLTADSISIYISENRVDSLAMYDAAFIISRDTTTTFNQIKGRTMRGYFRNNDLYRIDVNGNAETLYFVREDDGELIGINVSLASFMKIFLAKNQIQNILYLENPDETLFPEEEMPEDKQKLKDFSWQEQRRPWKKEDIFE